MKDITKTILELELSLLKPEVRSSHDQLNLLIADDFQEIGSSGLIYDKMAILENLPRNRAEVVYTLSDFAVRVIHADIVLATFKTERLTDKTEKVISLRSSLWRKSNDTWQMIFHQGTPTQ